MKKDKEAIDNSCVMYAMTRVHNGLRSEVFLKFWEQQKYDIFLNLFLICFPYEEWTSDFPKYDEASVQCGFDFSFWLFVSLLRLHCPTRGQELHGSLGELQSGWEIVFQLIFILANESNWMV